MRRSRKAWATDSRKSAGAVAAAFVVSVKPTYGMSSAASMNTTTAFSRAVSQEQ